jgi:AraC family transcriptional regulator
MTVSNDRIDYTQRMHRVLEYIDKNLDRTLELAEVARIAHFSTFHFHRVFAAWLGETYGEYLRRRRLEMAATRLVVQPRVAVMTVALSVGFGSTEAFSRAFKGRFDCTPSDWRKRSAKDRNPDQLPSNDGKVRTQPKRHDGVPDPFTRETLMKVSVKEWPRARVAYLRHVGSYGAPISQFWQEQAYPWMVANNLLGQTRYGVSHDDPGITMPGKCRYDAAVEVTAPLAAPGKASTTTLPGGKYAVTAFRGTALQIGAAWDQLLREWLRSSGLQLDARPFLEHYSKDSTYDPKTGVFTCELGVPVAPL